VRTSTEAMHAYGHDLTAEIWELRL
jgi:hypothetical protein